MTGSATMTTDQLWRAVVAERASLIELLETLSESDWNRSSLCEGWRVRDVVAHIVLSANPGLGWILVNVLRARGDFDRAIRETAIRLADRTTPAQLLAALREGITLRSTPIGTTAADRLMDLLVHGQDIAVPLGITRQMPVDATRSALERAWATNGFRARELSRYHLVATDAGWAAGSGPLVEGPAAALLLLVTGRRAGQEHLTGEGVPRLNTH
ncbi:maleylpyruvate isomerase family mycothiol-dependent enzyme [Nocardia arthritidis]|uniref:maleylpyruvate isomerase family mycothiol-dependent enzyme n=1 Tax=Nocardia arthritidis TaxID=228602 RepID=UPI0007A4910D|nr:maleylpyruvate isomerase family mycothiol-dependent enzyme [Nocardia arthritidis]